MSQPNYSKFNERRLRHMTERSTASRFSFENAEALVLGFIILVPILGCFNPPDIWLIYPGFDIPTLESQASAPPIATAVARFVTVAAVFWTFKNWRGYLSEFKYTTLILLQLIAFSSSVFWTEVPMATFAQIYNLAVVYLLLLYVIYSYTVKQYVCFLTRIFGIAALCSFFIIIFFPGMAHNLVEYLNVWRGAFVQKNPLGEASSLGVLTALYSWYIRANSRAFALIVAFASAILLLGSDSVTSIVTTLIGLALFATSYLSRSFLGKTLLLTIALSAALLAVALISSQHDFASLVGRNSGLTGRAALWTAIDGFIAQRPMHGYGLGFWAFRNQDHANLWAEVNWTPPEAHNDVRDVLLQTGYVGLIFYLINNFTALFLGLLRIRKFEDGSIFCLIIVVVFFYRSYTETASVVIAGKGVVLLYIAEAYLYKLTFLSLFSLNSSVNRQSLRVRSHAVSN